MSYEIREKVFMITGGCGAIGAGLTKAFLDEGAKHVAILDIEKPNGDSFEKQLIAKYGKGKAKFYKCDVTKELVAVFEAVVKDVGYIDVVVNNAGILNDDSRHYLQEIAVNFTALVTSTLNAYELMRKDHGGRGGTIVNISSIAGIFQVPAIPIYCATKSAVLQFTNCIGMEPHFSRSGVRMLTMCFGCTDTTLLASHKYGAIDDESKDLIADVLNILPWQKVESAVNGVVYAFKNGASASTWLVSAGKPAVEITENVTKGYEIMSQGVFDE